MRYLYTFSLLFVLAGCTRGVPDSSCSVIKTSLILEAGESLPPTRASNPDETLVTDWNVFVFNAYGGLEEKAFVTRGEREYTLTLFRDVPYTILAAANMGYPLPIGSLEEARAFRYHLSYPDEYSRGLPMVAWLEDVLPTERMELALRRLMARIDFSVDRKELPADVLVKVVELSVRGCPSSARLYPGSEAEDTFREGFLKRYGEVEEANRTGGVVSLYVLENCAPGTSVVVKTESHSPEGHTDLGKTVSYEIPLDELVRNTVYPVVLRVKE